MLLNIFNAFVTAIIGKVAPGAHGHEALASQSQKAAAHLVERDTVPASLVREVRRSEAYHASKVARAVIAQDPSNFVVALLVACALTVLVFWLILAPGSLTAFLVALAYAGVCGGFALRERRNVKLLRSL